MEKEGKEDKENNVKGANDNEIKKLLPMAQWGLDPVLYTSVKLSIRALLQAPQYYDFNSKIKEYTSILYLTSHYK